MKLSKKEIQLHGEQYPTKETMKHRFKIDIEFYPVLKSELVWDSRSTERGLTKKLVKAKNAKSKKPLWRKKRKTQRRWRVYAKSLDWSGLE